MMPSFLITFREVIEAALIVATILGILTRLGQKKETKTVWLATAAAAATSVLLLLVGSLLGLKVQELYSGKIEEFVEGILMIISAAFITWAVFFLHTYFGRYKTHLLASLKKTVEQNEQRGLFILAFTAVIREGFEIVLFLSTAYFSSDPISILTGFGFGVIAALAVCFGLFAATLRIPVYWAFKITSALLILFAAGLLAHGTHELTEAGLLMETPNVYLPFLPQKMTFAGDIVRAVFGVTQNMELLSLAAYGMYAGIMGWRTFGKRSAHSEA